MPIIGHKEQIKDLSTLAAKNTLGHGYIFFGPSMVGKRTVAQGLAHLLEKGEFDLPASAEVLQDARTIDLPYMKTLDINVKDSIGIDAIREIKNFLWQKPNVSIRRTLILDEAELLTTEAQNALLKITEEPPVSSLLIIVTSDIGSILPTIASRLPKIYFGPVSEKELTAWLPTTNAKLTKTKVAPFTERSFGKPGLAWRLVNDDDFRERLETAAKFLKSTPTTRKDFLKKLLEPDDFNLRIFLEAVIMNLAWEKPSKTGTVRWHKALTLYENASNFGLNPRLQLENLLR